MPSGSTVVIKYDTTDITNKILWPTARFECQINAVPGTFEFVVKDLDHDQEFVTGHEITLDIDGSRMYGGFVLQVVRAYPFPAMDTTDPTTVPRYWTVRGADYNRLFDKRVLRNPSGYTTQISNYTAADYDGDLIKLLCSDYLDIPSGFDTTTYVDNILRGQDRGYSSGHKLAWLQQGDPFRKQIEDWTQFTGALFYFDANKNLHHHAIESSEQRWGFSDAPNRGSVTASPASFQGATIGPREIVGTEDGSNIVNDAFIWGGSSWTQGVVFSRETNSGSITDHGRWQVAETHFGELGFGLQEGVDQRSNLIVNGSPGAVGADQQRGLRYPQWNFRFAWYAHAVPKISGVADHIRPGFLSTISLETFGDGVDPLVQLLPLRTMTITFPQLDPTGKGYVRFDGFFGLQPDDPFTLWRFLLKNRAKVAQIAVSVVDDSSDSTTYGALGHFTPSPATDGSTTVFTIPFGYIPGTTRVFLDGALKTPGVDYTESDNLAGEITMTVAPGSSLPFLVSCYTLAA